MPTPADCLVDDLPRVFKYTHIQSGLLKNHAGDYTGEQIFHLVLKIKMIFVFHVFSMIFDLSVIFTVKNWAWKHKLTGGS